MERFTRSELIESVLAEMDRVWGPEGFGGELEAYIWLRDNFGISEEEDVQWQHVLSYESGTLDEDTEDFDKDEKQELEAFINNEPLVVAFLEGMLRRYRSSKAKYPN